ncbi:MAG: HAD-IA family hydrolase [Thermoplasmata archaeon]
MTSPAANKLQAVLLDLGGTLVDMRDFPALEEFANRAGIPVDADTLAHWTSQMRDENDRLGERWSLEEFWRKVVEGATGGPVPEAQWTAFFATVSAHEFPANLYSDVRGCLDELAGDHLKLGVVTNHVSEQSARELLARAGVLGYFRTVVASGTERIAKPDPQIFLRAVERLKVQPHETLYVGDKPVTDVRAAENAGLHGLWLHRDGTGYGEDPPEITSLAEVSIWITQFEVSGRGFSQASSDLASGDGETPRRPRSRMG